MPDLSPCRGGDATSDDYELMLALGAVETLVLFARLMFFAAMTDSMVSAMMKVHCSNNAGDCIIVDVDDKRWRMCMGWCEAVFACSTDTALLFIAWQAVCPPLVDINMC